MSVGRLNSVFLAGLICLTSFCASAQSFDVLLHKADGIRTSDTAGFNRILIQLDQASGDASSVQRMQLLLLHAYQPLVASDYQTSIRELEALLAKNPDVDLRYRAGAMLANNYALSNQFSEGLAVMQRTLTLRARVQDDAIRQQGLLVAAILYNQAGQYQLGLRYATEVLSERASDRTKCIAGGMRIEALQHLRSTPSDEKILSVIRQCKSQHEIIPSGFVISYLARKWVDDKPSAAIMLLSENLPEIEATRYPRLIGEIHSLRGELLLARGDLDGAQKDATIAVAQKAGLNNTRPLAMAYKTLYEIAERRQDLVAALAYYKNYATADRGYLDDLKTRALSYQIVSNENQKKNQQIELLNRQNSLLQLQQRVDKQKAKNSRLLMLLFAVFTLFIAYWAYKTRRLQTSLRRMAETDALTGICNRNHFTVKSEQSLAQCAKAGEHAALIMFDLDHFKLINDSYGHATGDWVLARVAAECSAICRQMDHMGRVGGEEFAILLHGCDLRGATRIAEDCRVRLSRIDASESGYTFPITASFGVSATSMSGYDLDKLFSHADQMLYRAKREGRNRVRSYAPDLPIEMTGQPRGEPVPAAREAGIDSDALGTLSA